MKKQLLIAGMVGTMALAATAQRNCGTTTHMQLMQQQYPDYEQNRLEIEQFTQEFIQNSADKDVNAVITIPVVVHIVYNTQAQNLSDTRVQQQIARLNSDFRRLNTDASNTPSAFQSLAADCEIEFCLATLDPQGNPTTGITRTQTSVSQFSIQTDNIKSTSAGGKTGWNPARYLNIWVGNISGGILGYATPPGGPSANDGVVIGFQYFGNSASAPYNLGRTCTHEVGHWLNLGHIWGDDGGSCSGSDGVSDTPNQADEYGGCPSFPQVDACTPNSPGVMFMNYMDYTNDACMNMFTTGQKNRMRAALNGPRSGILTSTGCSTSGGGGGGGGGNSTCDTLSNIAGSDQLALYTTGTAGSYVGGTNTYLDKAKAEFFTGLPSGKLLTGALYLFGAASGGNGTKITATVWANNGGTPGSELANRDVAISTISGDVAAQNFTSVTFPTPVNAGTACFVGFKLYNAGETIAAYTNTDGETTPSTAWEQFSTNTWASFSDQNSWGLDVSLAVFPIFCNATLGEEEIGGLKEAVVYPNPSTGIVHVAIPSVGVEGATIMVYDLMGKLITLQVVAEGTGLVQTLDLSGNPSGVYMINIVSKGQMVTRKIILTP